MLNSALSKYKSKHLHTTRGGSGSSRTARCSCFRCCSSCCGNSHNAGLPTMVSFPFSSQLCEMLVLAYRFLHDQCHSNTAHQASFFLSLLSLVVSVFFTNKTNSFLPGAAALCFRDVCFFKHRAGRASTGRRLQLRQPCQVVRALFHQDFGLRDFPGSSVRQSTLLLWRSLVQQWTWRTQGPLQGQVLQDPSQEPKYLNPKP
jgi:hypothetical protein